MAKDKIKLHNEDLGKVYALQNIVRVIESRRIRWVEHVARNGVLRNTDKFCQKT
jgi:hypothetical protein